MITEEKAKDIFYNVAFKEKTYKEISEELGVHISTLCHHMKKFKPIFGINEKEHYNAYTYLRFFYKEEIINKYVRDK